MIEDDYENNYASTYANRFAKRDEMIIEIIGLPMEKLEKVRAGYQAVANVLHEHEDVARYVVQALLIEAMVDLPPTKPMSHYEHLASQRLTIHDWVNYWEDRRTWPERKQPPPEESPKPHNGRWSGVQSAEFHRLWKSGHNAREIMRQIFGV